MASKRMFSLQVIDSDNFLDLPASAQALYFHLGMRADDDGFVNNPKKIARMICVSEDDLKLLFLKGFIIDADNGIIVITHWHINNYIQKDRYHPTIYLNEKQHFCLDENKLYTKQIQPISIMDTQIRLD